MTQPPTDEPVPAFWGRAYTAPDVTVYYDRTRCIHYAACVRRLPQVFDPEQKPWIQADKAAPEQVAEVIRHCPTGALHYVLKDGPAEAPDPASVDVRKDGPNFLRGDLTIAAPSEADPGATVQDTRAALCRCGASANKPFCDGTHHKIGFEAPGGEKLNTW